MPNTTVQTLQGKVRGVQETNLDGGAYFSFKGIPYAQPPTERLRFKAPLPPLPWEDVLDATKDGNPCFSKDMFTRNYVGSEDSLILNVYTPNLPSDNFNLKPVMFWIHGGGFESGSSSSEYYGPQFLLTEDVVLVTINYRLGVLGFLTLEDPSLGVPGNAGFKDMVMALKWVQGNIINFGGNPRNVTIFGESAGGAAVHLLMLSPMSKGLFHKVIAQSGSAINGFAKGRRLGRELCAVLGCKEVEPKKILEYLQQLPVEKLLEAQSKIRYFLDPNKIMAFGVVVERTTLEPTFLSMEPIDAISMGYLMDVPLMIGYMKDEGMVVQTYNPVKVVNMVTDFETNIPYMLGYPRKTAKTAALGREIKKFYYGDEEPSKKNVRNFYSMSSHTLFFIGIQAAVQKHLLLNKSPTYFYKISIETSLRFLSAVIKEYEEGAVHGDDVAYLFKSRFTPELIPSSLEYVAIKRIVKLWTNFAYYGNPTPDEKDRLLKITWQPVTKEKKHYLDIGKELVTGCDPDKEAMSFWNAIFAQSPAGRKWTNL